MIFAQASRERCMEPKGTPTNSGFRVWGLGLERRVQGLGFRIEVKRKILVYLGYTKPIMIGRNPFKGWSYRQPCE